MLANLHPEDVDDTRAAMANLLKGEIDLYEIKHRTLILTNTGDQIYENALWAKRMRPDFDFVALEGGGVDIVDQQPEAWVDEIAKFIGV